jgi:hypothetical protein
MSSHKKGCKFLRKDVGYVWYVFTDVVINTCFFHRDKGLVFFVLGTTKSHVPMKPCQHGGVILT